MSAREQKIALIQKRLIIIIVIIIVVVVVKCGGVRRWLGADL